MFRSTYLTALILTATALAAGVTAPHAWAQGQMIYTEPTPPPAKVPDIPRATAQETAKLNDLREQWAKAHGEATAAIDATEKAEKQRDEQAKKIEDTFGEKRASTRGEIHIRR